MDLGEGLRVGEGQIDTLGARGSFFPNFWYNVRTDFFKKKKMNY